MMWGSHNLSINKHHLSGHVQVLREREVYVRRDLGRPGQPEREPGHREGAPDALKVVSARSHHQAQLPLPLLRPRGGERDDRDGRLPIHRPVRALVAGGDAVHRAAHGQLRHQPGRERQDPVRGQRDGAHRRVEQRHAAEQQRDGRGAVHLPGERLIQFIAIALQFQENFFNLMYGCVSCEVLSDESLQLVPTSISRGRIVFQLFGVISHF